jgi:glutamyl-tRNA synthetase
LYGHIAPVVKEDGKSRRKLSKRKDPEAAVSFYHEQGYPKSSIREYLLNLANSSFEDWRKANPRVSYKSFKLEFAKMSQSGALFDIQKLNDISKNVIAFMDAETVYSEVLTWAREYNAPFTTLLTRDPGYAIKIFTIDRAGDKPRKDIVKWSDVPEYIEYFYEDLIDAHRGLNYEFPENLAAADIRMVLQKYLEVYSPGDDKNQWFDRIREIAEPLGFCRDMKVYKTSPSNYKGHVGDLSTIIRFALTGRKNTPDLFEIQHVLGIDTIKERIKKCIDHLDKK